MNIKPEETIVIGDQMLTDVFWRQSKWFIYNYGGSC